MSPRSNKKTSTWLAVNFKTTWPRWVVNLSPRYGHVILVSGYLVLTDVSWSYTKEVHSKPRLHVSMSTYSCYLEYGRHVARLRRRRRRRAYAPTSNTASHDNHEKINSWVSFCFPYMGCLWSAAITVMYQSNRSLNIPSRAYPGHLMSFPAREGGNLMSLVFPEAGHLITTHRGWGTWSLASISCYKLSWFHDPLDVVRHGGDKPWCIQS